MDTAKLDLAQRIQDSEIKFNQRQESRDAHLKTAEEDLVEMTKLQGEWRVLTELQAEQANKQATVVEAVPDKKEKS